MPFAQQMFLLAVAALAIGLVLFFAFRRPRWREELNDTADHVGDTHIDLARPTGKHPALGASYRQGPVMHLGSDDFDEPWRRAERNTRDHPPRETRHVHPNPRKLDPPHVPLASRVPYRTPPITLTPRHLEHVNILRRRDGKPPLNAAGFRAAVALQRANPVTVAPIRNTNDWVTYLILYEVLLADHQSHRVAVDSAIVIQPDAPFNGQGGQFAGAGATSSFDAPGDPYAALAAGAAFDPGPLHDGSLPPPGGANYPGNDPQWGKQDDPASQSAPEPPYSAPEPQSVPQPDPPSYSAPEPSYSAPDTGGGGGGGGGGTD